jgi:hypothetical protein
VSRFIRPDAQGQLVTLGAPIMAAGQCQIVPAFDDFAVAVPFVRVGHWGNVGAVTRPTDQRRLFEVWQSLWPHKLCRRLAMLRVW